MKSYLEKRKKKKGFTLIELVVTISIMAILALIIVPNLTAYRQRGELAKHINNVRLLERSVDIYVLDHGDFPRLTDDPYTNSEIESYSERIYNAIGQEVTLDPAGNYYNIDYSELLEYVSLPAPVDRPKYILQNPVGKVFYLDNLSGTGDARANFLVDGESTGEGGDDEGGDDEGEEDVVTTPADDVYLAQDSDFSGTTNGSFRYIGTELEVKIPHTIKGVAVTRYNQMFEGTNVTKVVSDNPNITTMASMFYQSKSTTLDLSSLNTSNVTSMGQMFYKSNAETLDISSFDTSSVTYMRSMFDESKATMLDLSSFDTSEVTDMVNMFAESSAVELDLSSFNTSNVIRMGGMFIKSKTKTINLSSFDTRSVIDMNNMFHMSNVTTIDLSSFDTKSVVNMSQMFYQTNSSTGYARNQTEANKFNASTTYKPSHLTFTVK